MADLLSDSFVKRFSTQLQRPTKTTIFRRAQTLNHAHFFVFVFGKEPPPFHISSPNVLKRRRRHTKRNKTTFENDDDDKSKDEKRAKEEEDDDDDRGAMKKSSGGSFQNLQGKHEEEEEEETSFFVERISRVLAHTKPHQKVPFD